MRYLTALTALTALTVAAVLLAAPTVAEAEPLPLHSIWVDLYPDAPAVIGSPRHPAALTRYQTGWDPTG